VNADSVDDDRGGPGIEEVMTVTFVGSGGHMLMSLFECDLKVEEHLYALL